VNPNLYHLKRYVEVFALGIALAALALGPIAMQKAWAIWPGVLLLIVDIGVVFATIDYMAGQWVETDRGYRRPARVKA